MAAVIRGIVRNSVEWKHDPLFNVLIPKKANGVLMEKFDLRLFYSHEQIVNYVNKLKKERIEWLRRFENLNSDILRAVDNIT
jgi:phosphoenolpyruvate carboxykinase (ATP)